MIFLKLFLTFFKIGAFTVGGGYAMLPFIQSEVLRMEWMEEQKIIDFIAVSESTPGPFAINIATYIGSVKGGEVWGLSGSLLGSLCATLGVVLPSFIIILIVARMYESYKKNKYVKGVMSGLKPTVVGLIAAAILSILLEVFFPAGISFAVLKGAAFYISLAITVVMTVAAFKKVHPILIIAISAFVGIGAGYLLTLPV